MKSYVFSRRNFCREVFANFSLRLIVGRVAPAIGVATAGPGQTLGDTLGDFGQVYGQSRPGLGPGSPARGPESLLSNLKY
jgi:hypothetical protein